MKCVKCGAELAAGSRFCNSCGASQATGSGKCVKCGAELEADAKFCDACGAPQSAEQVAPQGVPMPPPGAPTALTLPPKKLVTYRMLSLFLGGFGVHSFYAGYTAKGTVQLVLGLFTGGIVSGIWALFDIFKVTTDAYGRPMEDTVPKNLTTYRMLAFFCGGIGAHNFYSGHLGRGLAKILLCWTGISWLWALLEIFIFVVKKDANGNPMVNGSTIVSPEAATVGKGLFILSIVFFAVSMLWIGGRSKLLMFYCTALSAMFGIASLVVGCPGKKGNVFAALSLLLPLLSYLPLLLGKFFRLWPLDYRSYWLYYVFVPFAICAAGIVYGIVALCYRRWQGIVGIILASPFVYYFIIFSRYRLIM